MSSTRIGLSRIVPTVANARVPVNDMRSELRRSVPNDLPAGWLAAVVGFDDCSIFRGISGSGVLMVSRWTLGVLLAGRVSRASDGVPGGVPSVPPVPCGGTSDLRGGLADASPLRTRAEYFI